MSDLAEIVADPNYVNANAETKAAIFEKHAPTDPNYANANAETQAAIREKFGVAFGSTPGGAAVGNPSIEKQGRSAMRDTPFDGAGMFAIGNAGALGGAMGAMSKEILTGSGNVVGSFPYPAARSIGGWLKGAGQVIGAGGRAAPAAAGAISGAVGETAGQTAELLGAGPVTAETARFVGGAISPELVNVGKAAVNTLLRSPAFTTETKLAKAVAKQVMAKLEGNPESLTDIEKKYLDDQIAAIRGPAGKTNQPLEDVGSLMGERGKNLMDFADQRLIAAQAQAAGVKPGASGELADIGGNLRDTIAKRNADAIAERSRQYTATEKVRDDLVTASEGQRRYVNSLPEYQNIVDGLKAELVPGKRSGDVQKSIEKILGELQNQEKDVFGQNKPISFQAIDDVRRKLGEVFKGKPAEGYEALNDDRGKQLYRQLTVLQKKYAGGETGPHAKLLDDYHSQSEALAQFRSKMGKKATALDQYQEGTFATDASTLPAAYFKTRASVQALKELTGNQAQVNNAALEFANKQLAGKDAADVRKWLSANSEWLAETGPTRTLIDRYATKLEGVEKSLKNAQDFSKQAAADSAMLTRNSLPAQRAVDLINSGDVKLWEAAIPAIVQSTQAKQQMVSAVRQVVADQATTKATGDLFSRNIRPFLEKANIATKDEMDFIAGKLANIQSMNVPEAEKLGIAKRIILQAAGGWAASAGARAGTNTYQWTKEKMVPE